MEPTRLMVIINVGCDWVVKMLYLNLLWILFTCAGLVVAGIFPATVAIFTVLKGFQVGENVRVLKVFQKVFKEEFGRANRLGIVLMVIPIIFYTDWQFTNHLPSTFGMIAKGILLGSAGIYGITLMYVFPVYLQVDRKVFSAIKLAFLIGLSYPIYTVMTLISIASLLLLFVFLPMAGFLFLASGLACILTFFSKQLFQKINAQADKEQKLSKSRWVSNN